MVTDPSDEIIGEAPLLSDGELGVEQGTGSRPAVFAAMAAWAALALHSGIDYLDDFPIVAFMGGVIWK